MKEIDMHYTFIKCAKRFISDIDEEELDWQLRTHQCYFDDSGPCCSDATLLEVFREATFNKVDESELYAVIEKICMCYCDEIKSARSLTSIIIPEGTTAIEHIVPKGRHREFTYEPENLVSACGRCNSKAVKGEKD